MKHAAKNTMTETRDNDAMPAALPGNDNTASVHPPEAGATIPTGAFEGSDEVKVPIEKRRGVSYARCSAKGRDTTSLDRQIGLARAYAERNGIKVVAVFRNDAGRSAALRTFSPKVRPATSALEAGPQSQALGDAS